MDDFDAISCLESKIADLTLVTTAVLSPRLVALRLKEKAEIELLELKAPYEEKKT